VLDPHIGLIYGDSITPFRADKICERLEKKGFASSNVVLGVGSYTYQYNTRDTYGFAMKATAGVVNGELREIYKDPITDDGTKKSLKGLVRVDKIDDEYVVTDQVSLDEEDKGELKLIFTNGEPIKLYALGEVRARLSESLNKQINKTKKEWDISGALSS
jgi:nicotinamide phosphoribosyltransferase